MDTSNPLVMTAAILIIGGAVVLLANLVLLLFMDAGLAFLTYIAAAAIIGGGVCLGIAKSKGAI